MHTFLVTKNIFCRGKSMLVVTKLLSWKNCLPWQRFGHEHTFVATKDGHCRDKHKNDTCCSSSQWQRLVLANFVTATVVHVFKKHTDAHEHSKPRQQHLHRSRSDPYLPSAVMLRSGGDRFQAARRRYMSEPPSPFMVFRRGPYLNLPLSDWWDGDRAHTAGMLKLCDASNV